jgi:cbb3-type cytochrome oxidase cytochrome c subunit
MSISIVWKFVIASVVLLIFVGITGVTAIWNNQSSFSGGTHDYLYWQQKYKDIAYNFATDAATKEAVLDTPIDVEQYTIQQFPMTESDGSEQQRVDRCESCHIGVENPNMTAENIIKVVDHATVAPADVPSYLMSHPQTRDIVYVESVHPGHGLSDQTDPKNPIEHNGIVQGGLPWAVVVGDSSDATAHARASTDDRVISAHPFATYGCTTCHYGSGRELVQDKAHGDSDFWLQPMLPSKYQDAACAQCHEHYDPKTFAAVYLPEMTTITRGQQLFRQNACWGCHKIEGYSKGNVGPELTLEGRIATYKSIEHQLWDPRYKVNNCVMPYFFSDQIVTDKVTGEQYVETPLGQKISPNSIPVGVVQAQATADSLAFHNYIPDARRQADVDALVTFITAQTGLNYAQDRSGRLTRLTAYNSAQPDVVDVNAAVGKQLFDTSGCYACHYLGDPNDPKNGHGGVAGPNLSWEGSRHSREWIVAHYLNPQAFVPKSIMPVFPFSDTQRQALAMYDSSAIPKGGKPVSQDQDMPTQAMTNDDIAVPQVRYMTR